jgi:hypothetical protein
MRLTQLSMRLSSVRSHHCLHLHPQFPHRMICLHLHHTLLVSPYLCSQATSGCCSCRPLAPTYNLMAFLQSLQAQHVSEYWPSYQPNWDEYHCNNFNYTMKCKAAVEQERCSDTSPYPQGFSWSEVTVNLQDVQIHPDTGTIYPWYCERLDDGVILNHPICLDMEAFLSSF